MCFLKNWFQIRQNSAGMRGLFFLFARVYIIYKILQRKLAVLHTFRGKHSFFRGKYSVFGVILPKIAQICTKMSVFA